MASRHGGSVSVSWSRLVCNAAGEETEAHYRVVGSFTPGHPGKIYGPPEDCYPPESAEVDYTDVFEVGEKVEARLDLKAFLDSLTKEQNSSLLDQLLYEAEERGSDLYDEAQERKYDEWKDRRYDDP